jgi:uncharacterized protein (TIGR02996 family)
VTANRETLLAAIRATPDDLDAYRVYGDWLSERGDPRGQLIAVQHALATAGDPDRDQLRALEARLLRTLPLWGALGDAIVDMIEATWRCGFVRAATVRELGADRAFAAVVHELTTLETCALLDNLSLESASWAPHALDAVVREHWPTLEWLHVRGEHDETRYDTASLCAALANPQFAPRLRGVTLEEGTFGDNALELLARSPRSLEQLHLSGLGLWRADYWQERLAAIASEVSVQLLLDDI